MAVDNNSFFQYNETRALSGYKSAWLVKRPNEDKYSLVGATESVPYVFGDKDTFEFDILQSPTKGQVEGKMSLDSQDIEVLHHRDNAYRFGKLKEAGILDFMAINAEFVGYKFTGTIDYRPNNPEADVSRATVTITPMSAQPTPVFNARPQVVETLCFASAIPATLKVGEKFDITVTQSSASVSYEMVEIKDDGTEPDATKSLSSTEAKNATISAAGLYAITAKADGYASWTTTVYVESVT